MIRSLWKWLALAVVLVAVLGTGTYFGLQAYIERRNQTWLAEADAAYEAGNWQLAKNYYERYIPQDRENTDLLLRYADACENLLSNRVGSLQSAAVAYLQILTFHPEKTEYRSVLLELYKQMGAWGNVEYYTKEWLGEDPENEDLRYNLALALDRSGRRDEAIDAYRAIIQDGTEYSEAYASLANLLRDRGLDTEAEAVFADALELRPDDAQLLINYARFLSRARDWEQVDAMLEKAYELDPDDPEVLIAQAQAAGLRDNYDAVVAHLRRAIEEDPDNAMPHLMLAGAYVAEDELSRAVDTLKSVDPEVQVDNPAILITLGDLQLSLRQFDEAKETLKLYNDAYPGQLPIEEYFAAKELLVQGKPTEAIERLAPVLELRPNFLQAQFTLAVAYLDAGQRDLARNTLDAYLAKNPSDVRARDLLLRNFGEPVSLDATVARANTVKGDEGASSETLFATGVALFESARRNGQVDQHADTARELLRRCIAVDPKRTGAYETLVELELELGNPRVAGALLDEAITEGVPELDLARPRVAVALESGKADAALAAVNASLASLASPSVDAYVEWARFLTARSAYEVAVQVLNNGMQAVPSDRDRTELALAKISMAASRGDFDEAIAMLDEIEPTVPLTSPMRERLNDTRLEIVQYLLATPEGMDREVVHSMVAAVQNESPDKPVLKTIDGFLLLSEDTPDLAGAKELFESAAAVTPRDVNVQWGLARVALMEQDYPRALTHAERAAALAPELPALQLQLGEILSALGRRLEAEKALRRVLHEDPDNARALQLLAASLIERKEVRGAREVLTRLERVGSGDGSTVALMRALQGKLLLSEGDSQEAERVLRSQVEANPDSLELRYDLAVTVQGLGRTDESVQLLQSWIDSHPSDPEGWVALARLYRSIGGDERLERASTALTRALVADPQFVPALREMLSVRIQQRNLVEAIGLCDRYLEEYPESADVLNTKALLLLESPGQLDHAESVIERTTAIDANPDYIATRGMIRMAKGEHRKALEDLLAAAAAMSPASARIDLALSEAYYYTRDLSTARKYYESAVQKSSNGEPIDQSRLARMGELLNTQDAAA